MYVFYKTRTPRGLLAVFDRKLFSRTNYGVMPSSYNNISHAPVVDVHIMIITIVFYGGHVVCGDERDDDALVTRCSAVGGGDKKCAGNMPVPSRPFRLAVRDCGVSAEFVHCFSVVGILL